MEREAPRHTVVALQRSESSLVPELWREGLRAGWLGILIPAELGGSESSLTDAAVLYEELGRGPLPGPFFSSGVLGALMVLEAATSEQRRAILPRRRARRAVLSLAITEPKHVVGSRRRHAHPAAAGRPLPPRTARSSS